MEKIRIQDDLYNYVNQKWMEKAVIPDDKPVAGSFADLGKGVEELLIKDIKKMNRTKEYPNAHLERACKLYKIASDTKRRNREGIAPAVEYMKAVDELKDIDDFNNKLASLALEGYVLPFDLSVDTDMKDTDRNIVYIQGPSTVLPDTTYYKPEMKAQADALLKVWSGMAGAILEKAGFDKKKAKKYIKDTLAFDAIIATMVKSNEEWSEYTKMYNITDVDKVAKSMKSVELKKLLAELFKTEIKTLSVADPRCIREFDKLFNRENFELYKHWAYTRGLIGQTGILSEELRELGSSYSRALTGVAAIPSVERYAYSVANSYYAEPIGVYYGRTYFGSKAKKDVVEMVHEIIDMYKVRIAGNELLSKETRKTAIKKLDTMVVKMGYPDKIDKFYNKMVYDPKDSYFNIIKKLNKVRRLHALEQLNKKTDRSLWAMPGNMVNACYNPFSNDITFPAAILQAPFYSIKQSRSQNLGGIGAVIGHEISHAFDNNGAAFDEKGNLCDWWTKEDFANFRKKTNAMIKQFDGIELPWGKVNAKLIVSENIADNGGMGVTLGVMANTKNACYEEYFTNWARVWRNKGRDAYRALLLAVDVHAPAILRANMPPRNFPEWYETFGVTKDDGMYIAPAKRIIIW